VLSALRGSPSVTYREAACVIFSPIVEEIHPPFPLSPVLKTPGSIRAASVRGRLCLHVEFDGMPTLRVERAEEAVFPPADLKCFMM